MISERHEWTTQDCFDSPEAGRPCTHYSSDEKELSQQYTRRPTNVHWRLMHVQNTDTILVLIQLGEELRRSRAERVVWVQRNRSQRRIGHGAGLVTGLEPALNGAPLVGVAVRRQHRVLHHILQACGPLNHQKENLDWRML